MDKKKTTDLVGGITMSKKRNYTLGERAIIYTAIAGGLTLEELNAELARHQSKQNLSPRSVPASSYNMVKEKYLPKIKMKTMWEQIRNPKSLGGLNDESSIK